MAGICRLCAVIKKSPHLTPITRCGIDFLNTVETVCNIKIDLNENNTLSRSVCSTCIEIVRKIDEFSSNVISSQSTLKLISNPIESNDRSDSPTIESIDLSTESEDEPLSKTQDKKKEKIIIKIEPKKSSIKKHSWTSVTSQCFGCSKKTIGILNIKNHLENCNKIEQNGRKIICGICRNKFISWHNYRVHIHRHAPHLKKMYDNIDYLLLIICLLFYFVTNKAYFCLFQLLYCWM